MNKIKFMARTPSNMLPLGTIAPKFELLDTISNTVLDLKNIKGEKGTVIMFICNHCPFVIHVNPEIVSIANAYKTKGLSFIAISSNDAINYPQDSPEKMKVHAKNEMPQSRVSRPIRKEVKFGNWSGSSVWTPNSWPLSQAVENQYRRPPVPGHRGAARLPASAVESTVTCGPHPVTV